MIIPGSSCFTKCVSTVRTAVHDDLGYIQDVYRIYEDNSRAAKYSVTARPLSEVHRIEYGAEILNSLIMAGFDTEKTTPKQSTRREIIPTITSGISSLTNSEQDRAVNVRTYFSKLFLE